MFLIMASGSEDHEKDIAASVEVYDMIKNDWIQVNSLNVGRHYHNCIQFEEWVYCFGGRGTDDKTIFNVERYNVHDRFLDGNEDTIWETINILANQEPPLDILSRGRDKLGLFKRPFGESEVIIIFGGDDGWTSETYQFDPANSGLVKLDCNMHKAECTTQVVCQQGEKYFALGEKDFDIHVYCKRNNTGKWFVLPAEYIGMKTE